MILLELFGVFCYVGLFSIGGGYAALPLIQAQVVERTGWLTMREFTDILTISQMTPGPIALNAATFVGTRIGGFAGACVATLGCVTPSFIIVLILAVLYTKYKQMRVVEGALSTLRPAVVGLIASAGLSIAVTALWNGAAVSLRTLDWVAAALFTAGLAVLRAEKLNPILVMLGTGVAGGIVYYFFDL